MPRYFFDIEDDGRKVRDAVGMELIGDDSAMHEGLRLLQTLADLRQSEGRPGHTYLRIRRWDGFQLYTATVCVTE